MRTNSQTSLDSTVLAISMVVPFPKPEWSWRASLLIFLVDCWSKKSYHHQARETLYSCPPGPSPDFWTCDSHWHISAKPWPSNPRPAKICKTAKCCHEKKHPNKPWLYSFGNEYGCPLPGGIGNSPDTATAPQPPPLIQIPQCLPLQNPEIDTTAKIQTMWFVQTTHCSREYYWNNQSWSPWNRRSTPLAR